MGWTWHWSFLLFERKPHSLIPGLVLVIYVKSIKKEKKIEQMNRSSNSLILSIFKNINNNNKM